MYIKKYLFIILACLIFLPLVSQAAEKSWHFDKWQVEINIQSDSSFVVKEEQTFNFVGNFHFVTRSIAKKDFYAIDDIKVYNQAGQVLGEDEVEITQDDSYAYITVNFDLIDTSATWIFEYTVYGGVGFYEYWDELYWNAVSSDREVAIDEVEVEVYLPENLISEELQATLYTGQSGDSDQNGSFEIRDDGSFLFVGQNIAAYENFTIVADWPKKIVAKPEYLYIESIPNEVEIFLNDIDTNKVTPAWFLVGNEIDPGPYEVSLKKWGYQDLTETKVVYESGNSSLVANMTEKAWYGNGRRVAFALLLIYILCPFVVLVYFIFRWKKYGRDPRGRGTIIPQYDPPGQVSPAVMGALYDEKVDIKDITAALIDLAYQGFLKIVEKEQKGFLKHGTTYEFILKKNYTKSSKLADFEKEILKGIFKNKEVGEKVSLEKLQNKFYRSLPSIKKELYSKMVELEYFKIGPDKVRKRWYGWGIFLAIVGFFASFYYLLGAPLIIIGILFVLFAGAMPQKTRMGVLAREHAEGFKLYLHTAERFRLKEVVLDTFEKYLSYAIVLGVEKEWAERFVDIYKQSPDWYQSTVSGQTFSINAFTSSLGNSFTTQVGGSFSSTPGGSSGGGSSGFSGGCSGGGGGGGGSSAG